MKKTIPPIICLFLLALFGLGAGVAGAGGLSQDVARRAMCEDALMQCREKVKLDFSCNNEGEAECRDLRHLPERKCDYMYKNCMSDMPVKSAKPVFGGKKKN